MASVWRELKRRNVVRVALAYTVVSWLLLQLTDVLISLLGLPDWVGKFVFLLLAIGFPVALILAWAFELTPEGLKRESEVDRSQSTTSQTGRRIDFLIIGVLAIAVGMLLVDKFLWPETEEATPSVAVLPFANMSDDASSIYFSDGLADTVLHMLTQVRELRVAARTSSFQFRDQSMDVAKIGELLEVGAVLEGSVQKAGDQIRVTAQLIDVTTGYHLWSGSFDRELDDVFAIQDEIAREVVSALKVSLLGDTTERMRRDQTDNIDAYTEYMLAGNDLKTGSYDSLAAAVQHFEEAIRIDPGYGLAYSKLAYTYVRLVGTGAMSRTRGYAAAREAAGRALEISPNSVDALAVLGAVEFFDGNRDAGEQLLKRAIENGPHDVVALGYYGRLLINDARPVEAIEVFQQVVRLDPRSDDAYIWLAHMYKLQRNYTAASDVLSRLQESSPDNASAWGNESDNEKAQGNLAAAVVANRVAHALDPGDPEFPFSLGLLYLALELPEEASGWFDRAVEIDAEHPVSRTGPLILNHYHQRYEDESLELARGLLDDRIDNRSGVRFFAIHVLVDLAARSGQMYVALETLDNLYPNLFDDPPYDLDSSFAATYIAGRALYVSGDVDRGAHLLQTAQDLQVPYDRAYGVARRTVATQVVLGDTDAALVSLSAYSKHKYNSTYGRLFLERDSIFDPLRNEPAFIALLAEYRENAEEQRALLQAMDEESSGR